jgi:hypothetical protein
MVGCVIKASGFIWVDGTVGVFFCYRIVGIENLLIIVNFVCYFRAVSIVSVEGVVGIVSVYSVYITKIVI